MKKSLDQIQNTSMKDNYRMTPFNNISTRVNNGVSRTVKKAIATTVLFGLLLLTLAPKSAEAQTILIETNFVDFSMELNPTRNPNLAGHVENFLRYVEAGIYNGNVINRAVDDFVIQMGNFELSPPLVSNLTSAGFTSTTRFDSVVVDANSDGAVDFDTTGLSNTRGEVSLALTASNPNSGNNSFFINLADNSFLDAQAFIPFARIIDMRPVDQIMEIPTVDFTDVVPRGSLAYTDVPVINNVSFLVIENVRVVPEASGLSLFALGLVHLSARRR